MVHFGTDGIRKLAVKFTEEYLRRIAIATASLKQGGKIIIGRDTRVSGFYMEDTLSKYLCEAGCEVIRAGILPTPCLAYFTKKFGCDFGIMLSASHNPPEYNGIKYFNILGEKLSDEEERLLDGIIDNPPSVSAQEEKSPSYFDGVKGYIDYIKSVVNGNLQGLRVCLDTSNGATAAVAPVLFRELGATVSAFYTEQDGKRINVNCGATVPKTLLSLMSEESYDIGFSYDGDGDRVMVSVKGKILNGDHLMYVHAKEMRKEGLLKNNTVVGTIMSNMGTEKAFLNADINFIRTPVGDKFVHREMKNGGYCIGGEESGHIIFTDFQTTGDGILASVLTAFLAKKCDIEREDDIDEYPSYTESLMCTDEEKKKFNEDKVIESYLNSTDFEGRVVVRPSGTEPKIRILVEAVDAGLAEKKAKEIKAFIKRRLEND